MDMWRRDGLIITDSSGGVVADCRFRRAMSVFELFLPNDHRSLEEQVEIARSVHAVPEMRAACEALLSWHGDGDQEFLVRAIERAQEAVAKITGVSEIQGG